MQITSDFKSHSRVSFILMEKFVSFILTKSFISYGPYGMENNLWGFERGQFVTSRLFN